MKKVRVFIERVNDSSYSAYMPDDNNLSYGVIGEGESVAEAVADFKGVYNSMKESFQQEGRSFEKIDFVFSYDLPSFNFAK